MARGVNVSEVFHPGAPGAHFQFDGSSSARLSGPSPDHASYRSYATFSDPDGNSWLLQEVTTRLPGRIEHAETAFASVNDLADALRRAAAAQGEHEKRVGQHDANWPTGMRPTWSRNRPSRSCRSKDCIHRHRITYLKEIRPGTEAGTGSVLMSSIARVAFSFQRQVEMTRSDWRSLTNRRRVARSAIIFFGRTFRRSFKRPAWTSNRRRHKHLHQRRWGKPRGSRYKTQACLVRPEAGWENNSRDSTSEPGFRGEAGRGDVG